MSRLQEKVAMVTGAASGMGAVEAELFAREGAKVAVCDIDVAGSAEVVGRITGSGGEAIAVELDVTSEESWAKTIEEVERRLAGPVTVLVNNAGIQGGRAAFEETTLEQWNQVMAVNGAGVFLGMRSIVEPMKRAGGGSIVNISSVSGLTGAAYPKRETTPNIAYYASKAAVRIMTQMGATQFGRWGIRVNSVHPGFIGAPMSTDSIDDPERFDYFMNVIPMSKVGRPEDVAAGVLYLASDESAFVSGAALVIDGAYTAKA